MPFKTTIARFVAGILLIAATAYGDEVKVMTSGAFTAAYLEIVPEFERATRNTVVTAFGASMGNAPDSIPSRLQRGEPVDVVIVADSALDDLIKQGKVLAGSRLRRTAAARGPESHRVFRRHRVELQTSGGGKSPDQIPRLAGRRPRHQEKRLGAGHVRAAE